MPHDSQSVMESFPTQKDISGYEIITMTLSDQVCHATYDLINGKTLEQSTRHWWTKQCVTSSKFLQADLQRAMLEAIGATLTQKYGIFADGNQNRQYSRLIV